MRIVLDTNVLLSAAFTAGACEVLLDLCLTSDDVTVIVSDYILAEFTRHATDKFHAPPEKIQALIGQMRQRMETVEPAPVPPQAFEDAGDLPVLGTAVAGHAEYLVTGDQKLLALATYRDISILSPRLFYDRLRQ